MDPLPLTRGLPLEQRHEDRLGEKITGRQIGDGNADTHRTLPRQPGHGHQAAHALSDLIEARAVSIWAGLTKARDGTIDDAWVDLGAGLVVDPQAMFHVWPIVFHDDISSLHEIEKDLLSVLGFQIEGHTALVAM